MRSIRKAAVAGAAAIALTLGSTTAAVADAPGDVDYVGDKAPVDDTKGEGSIWTGSSERLEGDKPANGTAIFGSSKTGFGEQPLWAQLLYGATISGIIATFIGTIAGPIHNFIVHGPQNLF